MKKKAEPAPPRRLIYYTPLRYPGGKAKLAGFVKEIIVQNELSDGHYVEPYAGGAGIALELLFHEYVSHIHINDISRPVFAFWRCVLNYTEGLIRRIRDTKPSVTNWDRQKRVLMHQDDYDDEVLGFATFFLNRTNRSGILGGGIIGGRDQSGPWKIDARYNASELIFRVESIARMKRRISLSKEDALAFLKKRVRQLPAKTLFYLDPPYYTKGSELYLDYYADEDHLQIASYVQNKVTRQKWIVSYDNAKEIRRMYYGFENIVYGLRYSARERRAGDEVMFFGPGLVVPPIVGAMEPLAA